VSIELLLRQDDELCPILACGDFSLCPLAAVHDPSGVLLHIVLVLWSMGFAKWLDFDPESLASNCSLGNGNEVDEVPACLLVDTIKVLDALWLILPFDDGWVLV